MDSDRAAEVINEKIAETAKNFDVLGALQKIVSSDETGDLADEIKQKLQNIMAKYSDMTEDQKEGFVKNLKDALANKLMHSMQGKMGDVTSDIQTQIIWKLALFAVVVLIVVGIFFFFGYKLYKSITDKQVKQEEKKKAKQLKKKK